MSLKTQSKVLRTLEQQRLIPVGSDAPVTVDVRVIASTNKDLEEEIAKGNFREDLFYRLNVIPFVVPPLRERKEDIPLFARYFLKEFASAYGRRPREITDDAIDVLMRYAWPGNVRELRNVVERLILLAEGETVNREHVRLALPTYTSKTGDGGAGTNHSESSGTLAERSEVFERETLISEIRRQNFHMTNVARALGLERSHLYKKCQQLGIDLQAMRKPA